MAGIVVLAVVTVVATFIGSVIAYVRLTSTS
jgi:hypothetical protein